MIITSKTAEVGNKTEVVTNLHGGNVGTSVTFNAYFKGAQFALHLSLAECHALADNLKALAEEGDRLESKIAEVTQ